MTQEPRLVPQLLFAGGLDILLAAMLATLSLTLGLQVSVPWALALDIAMCVAAAFTVRWPEVAGVALGTLLVGYFFVPRGSLSLGEYAPLIPLLGTGMRGLRRVRLWMTVGYGVILAALQYRDYPGDIRFLLGSMVWATLIAVLWLIGNTFAAFRRAQADARAAALLQQRLSLARDLHDTVARDLSRASLGAQLAQQSLDPAEMGAVVGEIQTAMSHLRLLMALLRDPSSETAGQGAGARPPGELLRRATKTLEAAGFTAALTIDGNPDDIPPTLWSTIGAVVGEASSNIERHALRPGRCALILSVDQSLIDMVFINEIESSVEDPPGSSDSAMGLLGVRERLTPIGGQLDAAQEDKRWITRVRIPLAAQQSSRS